MAKRKSALKKAGPGKPKSITGKRSPSYNIASLTKKKKSKVS